MNNHDLSRSAALDSSGYAKGPKCNPEVAPPRTLWGHFSEIDEDYGHRPEAVDWDSVLPLWLVFLCGLAIGVLASWMVL